MRVRSKDKFPKGHGGIKYCKFMSLNINNYSTLKVVHIYLYIKLYITGFFYE